MSFDRAVNFVLDAEGGYSNDPNDPGGETKYGISKRVFRYLDIPNLTIDEAKQIYREGYWKDINGDLLPEPWDMCLLDDAVNRGVPRAVKTLQRSLKVTVDGVVGDETINALKRAPSGSIDLYLADRLIAYTQTANFDIYGRGWFKRVVSMARAI